MNFFPAKKRRYIYVLLAALLWFHIFLTFSSREELNVGVLCTGGASVLQTLERTGSQVVLPAKNDRFRALLFVLFLLFKAVRSAGHTKHDSFLNESRRIYGVWEILIGKELASLPHSDMVLRI